MIAQTFLVVVLWDWVRRSGWQVYQHFFVNIALRDVSKVRLRRHPLLHRCHDLVLHHLKLALDARLDEFHKKLFLPTFNYDFQALLYLISRSHILLRQRGTIRAPTELRGSRTLFL